MFNSTASTAGAASSAVASSAGASSVAAGAAASSLPPQPTNIVAAIAATINKLNNLFFISFLLVDIDYFYRFRLKRLSTLIIPELFTNFKIFLIYLTPNVIL